MACGSCAPGSDPNIFFTLQARGIIDPHEKCVLRDLIVSGDERLQSALDKFEEGDSAELEALMASGHLNKVSSNSI